MDGTTFLPLRAVAELLGIEVSFDAATTTVILGEGGGAPIAAPATAQAEVALTGGLPTATATFAPGTFTASADGYGPTPIVVEVTFSQNQITSIVVVEHSESDYGAGWYYRAFPGVPDQILVRQSTQVLDAFSGATATRNGLVEAVEDAISQARANPIALRPRYISSPLPGDRFIPGQYIVTATGHGGEMTLAVTMDRNEIRYISVEHNETEEFWGRVWPELRDLIYSEQTTNVDLDAFSGATMSAEAVITGVRAAMSEAGQTNPDNQ
jgi:uncharacterized protein with FMN-binding domain